MKKFWLQTLILLSGVLIAQAGFADNIKRYVVNVYNNLYVGNQLVKISAYPSTTGYCVPPPATINFQGTFIYGLCPSSAGVAFGAGLAANVVYSLQNQNNTQLLNCELDYTYDGDNNTCGATVKILLPSPTKTCIVTFDSKPSADGTCLFNLTFKPI